MKSIFRKKSRPRQPRIRQVEADTQMPTHYAYHARRKPDEVALEARRPGRAEHGPARQVTAGWRNSLYGRVVLSLALVVGIALLVNVMALAPTAKVLPLPDSNTVLLRQDLRSYQTATDKILASSILNRTKLTLDSNGLSNLLRQQFPELATVNVTVSFFAHQPTVYIGAVQPALILVASNGSFVLDNEGKALQNVQAISSQAQASLPQVTDQSSLTIVLHRTVLPPANVRFIQTVYAQLAAKHIAITSMSLPPAASEVDVHLAGQPYYVKFNLQSNDARQQAGTFLASIAQLQQQHITPSQYVDVRVDGRAYYQ